MVSVDVSASDKVADRVCVTEVDWVTVSVSARRTVTVDVRASEDDGVGFGFLERDDVAVRVEEGGDDTVLVVVPTEAVVSGLADGVGVGGGVIVVERL